MRGASQETSGSGSVAPKNRLVDASVAADHGAVRDIQKVWHERAAALGVQVVVLKGLKEFCDWVIKTAASEDEEER